MTDEELEFESFSYRKDHLLSFKFTEKEAMAFDFGYVKGARNHGIVWHDLKKSPIDLPGEDDGWVCNQDGLPCWYDRIIKRWLDVDGTCIRTDLWCYMPHFEGKAENG